MSLPYIGEIRIFAGTFAPVGWAFCDGQLVPIANNDALFSLIGTTYGGDGQTTFALPDLRGRAPVHQGQGPGLSSYSVGESGGTEQVTLNTQQLPAHTHAPVASTDAAIASSPAGRVWAASANYHAFASGQGAGATAMSPWALAPAGGSQPHDNMLPFQAVHFIIALEGIWPSFA